MVLPIINILLTGAVLFFVITACQLPV